MSAAVETNGLSRRFGARAALIDIALRVPTGAICALVGPNGSGKSTALRLIAGLLKPTAGTIAVLSAQPGSLTARRRVSYIGDTPALYDDLSLIEHLELVAGLAGMLPWRPRALRLARHFGLGRHLSDLPTALSRGLRQRAALTLGLLRPFELLLLDEPANGLDSDGHAVLIDELTGAARRGATIIAATHDPSVIAIATHLIALEDGTITYDGPAGTAPGIGL